jgi:DNA-binding MarR family transcriptional regulator
VSGNRPTAGRDETFADCLRKLVQLFPQVSRGLRRRQLPAAAVDDAALGPRHSAALSLLRERGPMSVGRIASELGLTLATVSGIITDAERAGFVERSPDPGDRRRTIVSLVSTQSAAVNSWIDGASAPMRRVLDRLSPDERASFVKAMTLLEAELSVDSQGLQRANSKGQGAEPAVAAESPRR